MKSVLFFGLLTALALPLQAQTQPLTCVGDAQNRHLSGAALNSYMTKCRNDTAARCDAIAAARTPPIYGAARNSSVERCIREGVGQ